MEAQRILRRLEKIGKKSVTAETGYGPSGLPHIGTFGEVARTSFVLQALKVLAPDVETRLIAFSDDMDGLREVPQNLPNAEMLKAQLGKPLTSIPDPFGQEPSFAHYMNRKLREFLDSFGFEYQFVSSSEKYASGAFDQGLRRIMDRYEEVSELFKATIAEEKRAAWSPFFPVCEKCRRIYTARVTGIDPANCTVSYSCDAFVPNRYSGCGHKGTTSVLGGGCKVGWKVDWALRWYSLGIDYEMHGEDLLDSARLSSTIVKLLSGEPPELFKYELFLDENGKKISKKLGNGISIEQWLRFAPVDSLLYVMYMKPQQAKKMGLSLLPDIVDHYLELVGEYDGAEDSPLLFIKHWAPRSHAGRLAGGKIVTYSMLFELVMALNETDLAVVRDFVLRYQPDVQRNIGYFDRLIENVLAYYREVALPGRKMEEPGHDMDHAIVTLCEELSRLKAEDADGDVDSLQAVAFQVAKDRGVKVREWFQVLYRIFLGQDSGPKIGSFIALLGIDKAIERLQAHLLQRGQ